MSSGHPSGKAHSCGMNSAFTWSYDNLCIVFPWWHLSSKNDLLIGCLGVALWAYLYEYMKYYIYNTQRHNASNVSSRYATSLWYGAQVGVSFLLMLVMMTYNGYLMLSVVAGAILGHFHWGSRVSHTHIADLSLACH
ncbi:HEL103Cp [Eremothecium sinecaudum]|uniref:Copper transport protein n=1 Tax=Eremothecium sinecaudum TaxID=45286 RepID=A0A0X8HTI2_9SACH|nr:HEL103Cp [Eremothecium sinecaudum]AMD21177.1 HEL103Cp [Eremothecium sinecaudum]